MDSFWAVANLIVGITYFVISVLVFIKEYKEKQQRKLQQMLDKIPCVCGHEPFYHGITTRRDCMDTSDSYNMTRCQCKQYKMDNLIYLERLTHETRQSSL